MPRAAVPQSARYHAARFVPDVVNEPVPVDIRSFGIRTPPCTRERPTFGILGLLHILPPALAWLWRLVAPRGHDNPSITETEGHEQRRCRFLLALRHRSAGDPGQPAAAPNGYAADAATSLSRTSMWVRGRRGSCRNGCARVSGPARRRPFRPDQLVPARCPLLGYAMYHADRGHADAPLVLELDTQPEIGDEALRRGADILHGSSAGSWSSFWKPILIRWASRSLRAVWMAARCPTSSNGCRSRFSCRRPPRLLGSIGTTSDPATRFRPAPVLFPQSGSMFA